jgi:hypothetical protein
MTELAQLSLRALAVAPRAASVERCRRALKFGHGTMLFAGFRERSARNRARQRGLDGGTGSVGRIGRAQRPFRGEGSVTGIERDGGDGSVGPGGREGELHGRCHRLGQSRRAPSVAGAIEGQPAPGEQLEAARPPATRDERQLLGLGGHEWVDAAVSGAIGLVAVPPVLLGTAYGIWKENQLDKEVWQVIDERTGAPAEAVP